ncbi:hypothetical protein K440DRAFT_114370 [Wilcoxina mikolae CBS 423.85]|nr:hypothetical protein K440DRAFT_114370 [Wilcoxina mikolae CBS 423.85]
MPLTVLYYTFFVGATFFMQKVCFMVCGKKCASLCVNNVVLTACISAVVLGWKFESVIVHLPYTYSLWLSVMWMWLRFYGIPRMPCDQKLAGAETQV